ncbi:MAG: sensor histidine kinase [Deltaproteobacteria bacterium]
MATLPELPPLAGVPALAGLVDVEALRRLCESFAALHGVGLGVFDMGGFSLVDLRQGSEALHHYAESFEAGAAGLARTRDWLRRGALAGPATIPCFTGCRYQLEPLERGGVRVGRLAVGPYVPEGMHGVSPELAQLGADFDAAQGETLLSRIRRLSDERARELAAHVRLALETVLSPAPRGAIPGLAPEALVLLSHELRSPLTAVIGNADMLASGHAGPLSAEQQECAEAILERGQALLLEINSMLDLFGASTGHIPLLRGAVRPAELVDGAISDVAAQAKRRRIRISASVAPELHPMSLDRRRIQQSLAQLVGHAIQLASPGSEVCVEARRLLRGGSGGLGLLELTIPAFAPGIPATELSRLLAGSLKAGDGVPRPVSGLGLGLALVRAHAEAHGGQVEVTLGETGSRVSILLPIEPA